MRFSPENEPTPRCEGSFGRLFATQRLQPVLPLTRAGCCCNRRSIAGLRDLETRENLVA